MASNQVTKLNLINQSNDQDNSEVLIFQRNAASDSDELAIAWTVIQNLGQGDNHPFDFPLELTVNATDAWGNYTPQFSAYPGDAYSMELKASGDQLVFYPPGAALPTDIEVRNDLQVGAIDAYVYRDGKLLATWTGVAPGRKAVFTSNATIFIGVASQVQEGDVMNAAIISSINTELSLVGIASADILMTGGGAGPDDPFQFQLQNVRFF